MFANYGHFLCPKRLPSEKAAGQGTAWVPVPFDVHNCFRCLDRDQAPEMLVLATKPRGSADWKYCGGQLDVPTVIVIL